MSARTEPSGTPPVGPVAARFARPRGMAALWFGVLGAMVAWAAHLQVNYLLVPHACERGASWPLHLTTGAALVLALAALAVAWRSWRAAGARPAGDAGGVIGRTRFMALGGIALSLYFALLIVGESIPSFLVSPCVTP